MAALSQLLNSFVIMSDKVALITPSFNRAYIIGETAESIFAQTHENWEWVIVDDGSTDDSWDVIQSYAERDARVKAFQRNRGPKGACTCRNMAVERTDADWLIFLDTDDLLHPDCLKQRLAAAQAAKEREVLYFPILVFEHSTEDCFLWDDPEHPTNWLEGVLTMRPPVQGSGTFWPRALWDSHGGWREDLRVWQDIELHARAHWDGVTFKPAIGCVSRLLPARVPGQPQPRGLSLTRETGQPAHRHSRMLGTPGSDNIRQKTERRGHGCHDPQCRTKRGQSRACSRR